MTAPAPALGIEEGGSVIGSTSADLAHAHISWPSHVIFVWVLPRMTTAPKLAECIVPGLTGPAPDFK